MARDLSAAFEDFAAWCEGTSPRYARLAAAVADDPALLEVASVVSEDRSAPHVLLGAVHFLLLRGAGSALADYYPSVADDVRSPDAELVPAFEAFVHEHADRLRPILTDRRTQTNTVGRSAALYPAFAYAFDRLDAPPALVELGASAGLNLLWDRYAYQFDGHRVGTTDAPFVIECGLRGEAPPLPADPPTVRSRIGIDLNVLDPTDPDDADWLRALVWPEHGDRRRRLNGALEIATAAPPTVVEGDGIERLPELVGDVPADVPVCLYHTLVAYQLSADARKRLRDQLRAIGAGRELHWVASGGVSDQAEHSIDLEYGTVTDGELAVTQLGAFEAHGRWLRWAPEA